MKTITLNETEFNALLDGVRHTVSSDNARPAMQYIKIVVEKFSITAYSLDGYRASRFTIKRKQENADEFVAMIAPVPFKASKNGTRPVTISIDDCGVTQLRYNTLYGEMNCRFDIKANEFPNIERIYSDTEAHDREIGINALYVAEALKALSKTNSGDRNHLCVIESKDEKSLPFIIRAKGKDYENAQLVLPVRYQ